MSSQIPKKMYSELCFFYLGYIDFNYLCFIYIYLFYNITKQSAD